MGAETETTPKKSASKPNIVHINEEDLIRQIEIRPELYGRSIKSGVRHILWTEVSAAVGASMEDCKKRWDSLRGTYVKLYKGQIRKKKKWTFFDQMSFLAKELRNESSELNELPIEENNYSHVLETICYDDHHNNVTSTCVSIQPECERSDAAESDIIDVLAEEVLEDETTSDSNGGFAYIPEKSRNTIGIDGALSETEITINTNSKTTNNNNNNQNRNTKLSLDSDEHFLLSCAPVLRRLDARKNSLARLRIQQTLYDIEFG